MPRSASSPHSSSKGNLEKTLSIEVGSILIFMIGVFLAVSIFTFSGTDPSVLSSANHIPKNGCGRIGATIASILLSFFGMGAFLVPLAFFFLAGTLRRQGSFIFLAETCGGIALATVSLTVFLALPGKPWLYGGAKLTRGGAFGLWSADALIRQFNFIGSCLIVSVLLYISLAVFTPFSVLEWTLQFLGQLIRAIRMTGQFIWLKFRILPPALKRIILFLGHWVTQILGQILGQSLDQNRGQLKNSLARVPAPLSREPSFLNSTSTHVDLRPGKFATEFGREFSGDSTPTASFSTSADESGITILPREASLAVEKPKLRVPVKKAEPMFSRTWALPPVDFLREPPRIESPVDRERLISHSRILKQKFADFGIDGEVTAVRPGPVITLYEFKPGPGVKVSRIAALTDDLSMALSAQSVRILAPLPGKSVVGIEIPSETREMVYLREFLQHPDFYGPKHTIPVIMGKEIGGQTYLSDLARMPHLLCAGQTGSGKSVFMNGLICSLFYRFTPDELRMILVDPKFIEFRAYQEIPHLLLPVVDDPKQASLALRWAVREMERRYRILAQLSCRNLAAFNQKVEELGVAAVTDLLLTEEKGDWVEAFEPDEKGQARVGKLPYIVIIIDELADLMMVAKKEVEISIARIAQKARAAGIHLVIATQRPSTDVITGLIKANLPSRVSFQLASYVDSKTILDRAGAERLLGQGDMLFIPPGVSQNLRLHGAFLDDEEIEKITTFLKGQGQPAYRDEILFSDDDEGANGEGGDSSDDDELFKDAISLVKTSGHASASFLQRNLKVGYNRAARMIETMEARGIVGPQDGARPREVLVRDI